MRIPGVKFQSTEASCGAAALANYFVMTGYSDLSEQQIMEIAGTNWNGTEDPGEGTGVATNGVLHEEILGLLHD